MSRGASKIRKLQERLDEAEEALRALRSGEVDAIVAAAPGGDRVYTLQGADEAYRLMVQTMAEGALTVGPNGLILFSNENFASMIAAPLDRIIGSSFHDFVVPEDAHNFSALLALEPGAGTKSEVRLKTRGGVLVPVRLSVNRLKFDGVDCFCVIVADLTEQKQKKEVLRALSTHVLQVQDEERRLIARGLHDGTFQRLAALEINLTRLGRTSPQLPLASRRILSECVALVGECCTDLGKLAYQLQPPLLEEQGLGPALTAYVNGYNRRLGPQISLTVPSDLSRLPCDVETTLFRVTQEALTNIERHSRSATAEIRIVAEPPEVLLDIADHGCGISPEIVKRLNIGTALPGVGIAGMRERVRQLGGFLKIFSGPAGTTVSTRLPLEFAQVAGGAVS